jgi:hypothetical protein
VPAPRCALGFAPHSGWAAVVIVGGTVAAPRVLARERVELIDVRLAGSRQPYHALEGLTLAQARQRLEQFENSAAAQALAQLQALLARTATGGHEASGAALLDSAAREGASLEEILASHTLIHAAEGNHFRAALAGACAALGLPLLRIRQRELTERAALALRQPLGTITAAVAALGHGVGPPWGADQKSAALVAWLKLAEES